jgi:hypothetical protein
VNLETDDDLLPEYDFDISKAIRGKHYSEYKKGDSRDHKKLPHSSSTRASHSDCVADSQK